MSSFDEWRKKNLTKAPQAGGARSAISPGYSMSGQFPFSQKPNGNSKYGDSGNPQPPNWIEDVDTVSNFFSPMQPIWPFGPPSNTNVREWDYPTGYNLNFIQQRMNLMGMLRGMRNSWGVLATIIETRKDQLLRVPWTIQRKKHPGQDSPGVDAMKKFFKKPDGKLRYSQWSRKLLDDLLVLDAPSMYVCRDRLGRPLQIEILDAITIFPLIDDAGRRPDSIVETTEEGITYLRRQPAFQQIIKGMPNIDLDESQLLYVPMRPRPEMPMFGYPGTEQILVEASEAVRKTFYQLGFWAEGSIPDLVVTVPDTWMPRQIAMFQAHFDALLSGNLALKSKVRFLPGGMKPFDIKNANGETLWSQRDETLIRLACYAYSVSPTPFVKQLNRCYSADTETLTEKGWRTLDQIGRGERIATVNPITKELEYHVPTQCFVYGIDTEEMVHFKTKTVDVLVTPEHDMWMLSNNKATEFKKVKAVDHPRSQFFFQASICPQDGDRVEIFTLPSIWRWVGTKREDNTGDKEIDMDVWLQFLGYFISEGGLSYDQPIFTLSQHIDKVYNGWHVHDRMNEIFRLMQINSSRYVEDKQVRWTVGNKQLCDWLRDNVGVYSNTKRIPREFLKVSRDQLNLLFHALMAGDGTWDKRENRTAGWYGTTSKQLADDVQELAFLLGYSASVTIGYVPSEENSHHHKGYVVNICRRSEFSLMGTPQKETPGSVLIEPYEGTVYCFDVPNHLFVTRRNGKIGIHGNSVAQNAQQSSEEEGLFPLMSYWKDDIIDPIIQEQFGMDDIEFVYLPRPEPDAEKQSKIHQVQVKEGIKTRNEARAEIGLEPLEGGDVPMIELGNIIVPLDTAAKGDAAQAAGPQDPNAPKPNGKTPSKSSSKTPSVPTGQPQRGKARPNHQSTSPSISKATRDQLRTADAQAKGHLNNFSSNQLNHGNYPKGHIWIQGLNISIENAKNSIRGKKDAEGNVKWSVSMPTSYGYIRGTVGADDDHVDCFIGKYPESDRVWVIDQKRVSRKGNLKGFDEHKCMIGYKNIKKALKDYLSTYSDRHGLGSITELSMKEFKDWLSSGDLKEPIEGQVGQVVLSRSDLAKLDTISASTNLTSPPYLRTKKRKKSTSQQGARWLQLNA